MTHLVAKHVSGEVLRRAFKLKVEGIGTNAIDLYRMVNGVVWEILHVRPKD